MTVNDFELNILELLAEDARMAVDQIAVMTGHDAAEVRDAIKRLEENKVIVSYPTLINWDNIENEQVEALIEVRVSPQRGEGFDAIAEEIYRFDECSSVYLISGAFDLLVIVRGRSVKQTALFVAEKLSTIENVLSTATHFVLKTYKLNGVVLEGIPADNRLAVTP